MIPAVRRGLPEKPHELDADVLREPLQLDRSLVDGVAIQNLAELLHLALHAQRKALLQVVDLDGVAGASLDVAHQHVQLVFLLHGGLLLGLRVLQLLLDRDAEEVLRFRGRGRHMTINGAEQLLGILLHVASLVALRELGFQPPQDFHKRCWRNCLHRGVQHFEGLRERPRKGVARVGRRLPSRVAHDPPQGRAQLRNGAKALERAVHVASIAEVHKASRQRLSGGGLLGRREVFHEGRGLHGLLDDLGSTHEADVRPIWQVFQAGVVLQNAFPAPSAHELLPRDRHASQLLQPLLEGQRRGAGVHFEVIERLFIPLHSDFGHFASVFLE
mmetsp:Transcript_1670/g.7297  ORF Transcript_1670/g.7297 Transcript_1670/m.7297 type:complete len:330 (+) Transcript_1670:690-1679(+)